VSFDDVVYNWPVCRTFHVYAAVVARYSDGVGRKDGYTAFMRRLREIKHECLGG